jgi:hypothetical protein
MNGLNNLKTNKMEIKPTYVTFEQAKGLKEKGLIANCKLYWVKYSNTEYKEMSDNQYEDLDREIGIGSNLIISKYEQWQVVEWLRVNHGIWITVTSISQESWQWHITKPGDSLGKLYEEDFYSPQEAYEAAIEYCLRNLI